MEYLIHKKSGPHIDVSIVTSTSYKAALAKANSLIDKDFSGTVQYDNIHVLEQVTDDVTIEHGIDYYADGSIYQWYTRFYDKNHHNQEDSFPPFADIKKENN